MPSYLVSAKEAFVPTELYTPPIESIGEILRIKQGRYDQAWNQANNQYLNIRDAKLLSSHGQAKKEQFLKQADQAIQQLATVDLSLPENQTMANGVFKPFWDDKLLVREVGLVTNAESNIAFAEQLRNSTDEKQRKLYNPYSIQDQQNLLKEIAESNPEDIERLAPRAYTNNVDITKEMDDALKNLGITNAQVREMPNGGGYKIVDQFGKESVLPLTDFFMSSLSGDARAYLQTMGRVQGRSAYENALQLSGGDRVAARSMVSDNIIGQQKQTIEKTIIPELNNALSDAENKINAIINKRRAAGSQLTEEDAANIEQYKQAALGYKKKIQENSDVVKSLGDKNSELYGQYRSLYSTTNGYNDAYTSQIVSGYANGWARSRAQLLSSQKVDADQAWKNIEDVITARKNIEAGMIKNDQNNDVRLQIAELKAAAKGNKGSGSGSGSGSAAAGAGQPIYLGRSINGNKPVDKFTQWATGYSFISDVVGASAVRLFEKTLNERAGLTFTTKVYEGVEKGDGSKPFFTSKDTPEYKAFSKAINDGVLKLEPGRQYSWTYDEVFDLITKNTTDYLKTPDGLQAIKNLTVYGGFDQDAKNLSIGGDLFKMARAEQEKIHNTILKNDKYKGYTTSEGGVERLKSVDELTDLVTIPMRNANGEMENIKISDLVKARESIQTTSDNGVYIQGSGTTGRTYTSTATVNGQEYQFISGSPDLISNIKAGKTDVVARQVGAPYVQKLEQLKKDFNTEFEKISPDLMFSQKSAYNDMLNYGSLLYTSGDKNAIEAGEKAAIQLLGEENISGRYKQFIGVEAEDLEPDSPFMKVVNAVAAKLPDMALSDVGPSLQVDAYNDKTGGAAYKIKVDKKSVMEALGVSAEALAKDAELSAAVDKFLSPEFKIAAPANVMSPGDIITGYSPIETYVQQNGYKTPQYMDDLKVGGFNMNKLTNGGFQLNTWHYEMDPATNALKRVDTPLGTIDATVNITQLMDVLYNQLYANYKSTVTAERAADKVNGTVSLDNTVESLRKLGINVN